MIRIGRIFTDQLQGFSLTGKNDKRLRCLLNALLILIGISFCGTLYPRVVDIDDAWSGAHAYWFAKRGYVRNDLEYAYWARLAALKADLFRGAALEERKLLVDHKLWTIQGGLFIRCFGMHLYLLKAISLGYLFVALWLAYLLIKGCLPHPGLWYRVFLVIFLFNLLTFEAAFRFRPEMMLSALGLLSYYCLDKSLRTAQPAYLAFAGLAAGLAMAAHLNGVVYVVAGVVLLVNAKRLAGLLLFGSSSVVGFLPYFYDMLSRADLRLWLLQFRSHPGVGEETFHGLNYVFKTLLEINRFLHSPKEQLLTCLLIVIGAWSFEYVNIRHRQLLLYTGCLVLGLAVFAHNKTPKYLLAHLPFLCLLLTLGLRAIAAQARNMSRYARQYVIPFALTAYVVGNYIIILIFLSQNWNWDMIAAYRTLTPYLRPGAQVLAPITFAFDGIRRYAVQGLDLYVIIKDRGMIPAATTPFQFAAQFGNEYVILDHEWLTKWQLTDASAFGSYECIHKELMPQRGEQFWVFRRKM